MGKTGLHYLTLSVASDAFLRLDSTLNCYAILPRRTQLAQKRAETSR
ncbi:hypothetical protein EDC20_103185 [Gluconobacter oxydans]|nr:hypothetical protein EDC20_103185 [Gluconobacter oxydans]